MRIRSFFPSTLVMMAITCTASTDCRAQDKPLFTGAEHLDSCVVDLPLTYAKKDKERYMQAARFLEDQELIYLNYDKKEGKAFYSRVYVVVQTTKDGSEVVHLESTDDHLTMGGVKEALFPKFKASTERFYNADCFDRRLAAHPELQAVLVVKP
jgi:hypothetical protein